MDCLHYNVGVSDGGGPLASGNLKGANLQLYLGQSLLHIATQPIETSAYILLQTSWSVCLFWKGKFWWNRRKREGWFWLNCLGLRSKWLNSSVEVLPNKIAFDIMHLNSNMLFYLFFWKSIPREHLIPFYLPISLLILIHVLMKTLNDFKLFSFPAPKS